MWPQHAAPARQCAEANGLLNAGDQYEAVLNSKLAELGIEFWTEASLREQGYFKTPDALLQVDRTFDICLHAPFIAKEPDRVHCLH